MGSPLSKFKPGATRRVQLLFSAFLWSAIGLFLLWRGSGYLRALEVGPGWVIGAGLIAGTGKSLLFLDRASRRTKERILGFGDDTCLGAVYSVKTWLLVLAMAVMGALLRNSAVPGIFLCFIFFAVGWSLLFSARIVWGAWFSFDNQAGR